MDNTVRNHFGGLTKYMGVNGVLTQPLPKVVLNNKPQDGEVIFNSTGYYDPNTRMIVLYTHGRHPKDILRSFAHEMIHHDQNLQGLLDDSSELGTVEDPKYAQNDKRLREMEEDAYLRGNMLFRDYTDNLKYPNKQIT